jgi:hypothetical protein
MGPDQVGQILNFPTSPANSESPARVRSSAPDTEAAESSPDLLNEVDRIFEMRARGLSHSDERQSQIDSENARLQDEFTSVCASTIRPAMQAFLERLRANGGGGLLEERSGVHGAGVAARITLWMSLSGELIGRPRRDQHPYLQLDFDAVQRQVVLVEGDMWKGHGTSGPVGTWAASEITGALVTESLLDVLRRAGS